MPSRTGIDHSRTRNTGNPCNQPGCHQPRRGLSSYCAPHERHRNLYGHPMGRSIQPKEYASEKQQVVEFVSANINHGGIQAVMAWIAEVFADGASGRPMVGALLFSRLHQAEVSPRAVIEESAALWLYSFRRPASVPDDERLTYALGIAVLSLMPRPAGSMWVGNHVQKRYQRHPGKSRQLIGTWVRNGFGVLLIRMTDAIQSKEARGNERTKAMHLSFNNSGDSK
jgi:hypothetical protein